MQWYVVDLSTGTIREDAQAIVDIIRTQPDEPRRCVTERQTLSRSARRSRNTSRTPTSGEFKRQSASVQRSSHGWN